MKLFTHCVIMLFVVMLLADLSKVVVAQSSFVWYDLSKYDHFTKRPTVGIRAGGRLTEREVSYIRYAGYNSYISTVNFTSRDTAYNGMEGNFPSTQEELDLAESLGMEVYGVEAELTVPYVQMISNAITSMKKPVYIHCHVGFTSSLFTLLHLYLSGAILDSNILSEGLALGWDYQATNSTLTLINQVTGMKLPLTQPVLELNLANQESSYKTYYWTHRLSNDTWYNVGQVLETHVNAISEQGYETVVSFRANGEPTTRISTDLTSGPIDNNEFSDQQGYYNVTMERLAFEAAGIKFFNLPVTGSAAWQASTFFSYLPTLEALAKSGAPVLAHCTSGYRSSAYVATYLAYSQGKCTTWAINQASKVGYSFSVSANDAQVVSFMQSVLKCYDDSSSINDDGSASSSSDSNGNSVYSLSSLNIVLLTTSCLFFCSSIILGYFLHLANIRKTLSSLHKSLLTEV